MVVLRFARVVLSAAILLVGATCSAAAQSDDELRAFWQRINDLYRAGRDAEAIPLVEKHVQLTRDRFGDEHADYATALHALGALYIHVARAPEAEVITKQSLAIRERVLEEAHCKDPKIHAAVGTRLADGGLRTLTHEPYRWSQQSVVRADPRKPSYVCRRVLAMTKGLAYVVTQA